VLNKHTQEEFWLAQIVDTITDRIGHNYYGVTISFKGFGKSWTAHYNWEKQKFVIQ